MADWLKYVIIAIVGYLLGNISLGIIISKLYGIRDIRKHGSGGSGTTNVLRTIGWLPSVLTLIGDALKAFIAAELGYKLAGDVGLLIGGFAAIVGHDFPVFLGFRGGKGIACSIGFMFAMNAWVALIVLAVGLVIVAATRYMSIASIVGSILFPILTAIFMKGKPCYTGYVISAIVVCLLNIFSHRANISRLINHNENRLDFEKISKISQKFSKKR